MGNMFGQLFRVTTFGESHGGGIGVVIDGCPPRIEISEAEIQRELDRRRPGQSKITTQREEEDRCEILSGVFDGKTLGTPIAVLVRNKDARPEDYSEIAEKFRPSHADFTYEAKYGIRNWQGGGRASARETIGRVAGGAGARQVRGRRSTGLGGGGRRGGPPGPGLSLSGAGVGGIRESRIRHCGGDRRRERDTRGGGSEP